MSGGNGRVDGPEPPHDAEVEMALLGELLMFPDEAGPIALPVLKPEDLYVEGHQPVMRALLEAIEDGRPHDVLTLRNHLEASGTLNALGGAEFLIRLSDAAPTGANIGLHVDILKECAIKRGIIQAGAMFMEEGRNGRRAIDILNLCRVRTDELTREAAGSALKTFSAADLPSMDIEALRPVVGPNLLSEGGFLAVVGKQGLGKTYAVFDLALLLARGRGGSWLGNEVAQGVTPVLWLFGEGGKARVKDRALQLTRGAELPSALHFHVPEDYALDLCSAADVAKVRMTVERLRDIHRARTVAVVIDPLADWAVYDQNTEADRLLRGLRSLQRDLNATPIVVHHPKKPQMGTAKGDSNNARGDSRLAGAVQSMLMFDPEEDGKVRLTWAKHNDSPAQEPVIAKLHGGDGEEEGAFRFVILHRLSERQSASSLIYQALRDAQDRGENGGWVLKKLLVAEVGAGLRTVERHLGHLVKTGQVEADGTAGSLARYRLSDGA